MIVTSHFLLALLAIDGLSTSTDAKTTQDPRGIVATLEVEPRWCERRADLQMTVTNLADSTMWLSLPRPSLGPITWMSYSLSGDQLGEIHDGISCGGNRLAFIRSSKATKLLPGKSATWKVRLEPRSLRPGAVDIVVWARIDTTRNLGAKSLREVELRAAIPVVLTHDDGCFEVRRRLTRR